MIRSKTTKEKKPKRAPKLSRDEQNKQAFREVAEALEKVQRTGDRDRILEAVGSLLGSR